MLGAALANIHRDPQWWWKIGIGGALMLTVVGIPLAAGLVIESLDNSRKGFPTPLPPWIDWSTRYLIGLFALLIDFVFFGLPLLVLALASFCASVAVIIGGSAETVALRVVIGGAGALAGGLVLAMFLSSVAPMARLFYVREGRIEEAISMAPLRAALRPGSRRIVLRARLASLPAYLPAALAGGLVWSCARASFPGQGIVLLLLLWLALSALLYAHLAVAQIYAAADKSLRVVSHTDSGG